MRQSTCLAIFLVVVAASLIAPASCTKDDCLKRLQNMTESYSKDFNYFLQQFRTFYLYSGKQLMDMGNYLACQDQVHHVFSTMLLTIGAQTIGMIGLCMDAACDADSLNQLAPHVQELLVTTHQLEDYAKLGASITPTFIGLSETPSYANAGFWITVVLCALFFTLSLVDPLQQLLRGGKKGGGKNSQLETQISLTEVAPGQKSLPPQREQTEAQLSFAERIFDCFSLTKNWDKLCNIKQYNEELKVYNGIRFFSCLEVVYGHCYSSLIYMLNYRAYIDQHLFRQDIFLFVYSNYFSVDVFFYLGGFFIAYVLLDPKKVTSFNFRKPLNIVLAFAHRLIRLWPSLIICLLIYWKVSPYMASGPLFSQYQKSVTVCDTSNEGWWQRLLFISNLTENKYGISCYGWAWYLDNDIQIFIACLLLLAIYYHNSAICKLSILTVIAGATIGILYVSFYYDLGVFSVILQAKDNYDVFVKFYIKPWMRCPPYFLGLLFGVYYREYYNEKKKGTSLALFSRLKLHMQSKWYLKWVFYIVGTVLINFFIWGPKSLITHSSISTHFDYWPSWVQDLWNSLSRLIYCFAIGLVALPGMLGSRDVVARVSGCAVFAFFTKLTYTIYLVHLIISELLMYSLGQTYVFSETLFQSYFLLVLFLSVLAAILLHLFVELPWQNIDSLIFAKKPREPRQSADELKAPLIQ